MFKVVYSHKVQQDLRNISDFIARDNPLYAIKTVHSIMKTIEVLEKFPYVGKEIIWNIRELVEKNYRYKIVYEVWKKIVTIVSIYKYQDTWKK